MSVITPSYNQGRFVERTIRSVLEQSVAVDEYVVFDGGSTDETVAVLKSFGDRVTWTSRRDRGQSDAVNQGIRATKGDVIGWLNSDDVYDKETCKTVLAYFKAHPEIDVVYGNANLIDESDAVLEPYRTEAWSLERLKSHCIISQPAAFIRRSAMTRYGMLDDRLQYCMDYEYWLRLSLAVLRLHFTDFSGDAYARADQDLRIADVLLT